MVPTVDVTDDAKSRLEELRAAIRLRAGVELTEQELLTWLIADAYESPDDLVESFRESTVPLSEDEKETMRKGRIHSDSDTGDEDDDEILYGDEPY